MSSRDRRQVQSDERSGGALRPDEHAVNSGVMGWMRVPPPSRRTAPGMFTRVGRIVVTRSGAPTRIERYWRSNQGSRQ